MGPLLIFILSASTYTKCESECWSLICLFTRPGILKKPPIECLFLANNIVSIQLHSHMELVNQMPMNNKLWKYNKYLLHLHLQPPTQNT